MPASLYPIVEYAHKIGKNTSDLTTMDMVNFMKWWVKQVPRKDLMEGTVAQKEIYNKDVAAMNKYREDQKMAKHTTSSYQAAQTSRLAERGIESPINEGEEEIIIHDDKAIVAEMGLTKLDVESLKWAIRAAMNDYNVEGELEVSLKGILEVLEGV